MQEPEEFARRQRRLAWLVVAGVAAALAALAPADWPPGPAELVVEVDGTRFSQAVVVGSAEPLESSGEGITVTVPDGLPLDAAVTVVVEDARARTAEVSLVLGDGRVEHIPVASVDAEAGSIVARRQPLRSAMPVLALLGAVVVLWVSEALPLWVTSLIVPAYLATLGVVGTASALAPFFHPIIVLFFAGFLLAEAMRRVGLDRYVAHRLVALSGRTPVTLYVGFVVLAAGLSMFMSNTAAVAVLIPIAMAVTEPIEDVGYRRTVILGTAYAATIGGVGSAIGTPANPLAITFLEDVAGRTITFVGWFAYGLPMLAVFLPVMAIYLWRRMRPHVDEEVFANVRAIATRSERPALGRDQWLVLAVFVAVVVGWVLEPLHGVHIGIVALLGVLALAVLRRIETADLGRISWASLLTFGGGLTLGLALTATGVSDWLAVSLGSLSALPATVGVALVALAALALTTVASNTAAAAMFIPLAIPLAGVLGVDPVLLVVVVAIASSVDFALVIGTPPTLLAYSTGLYTPREILRVGGVLDLAGVALLVTVVAQVWRLFGLVVWP